MPNTTHQRSNSEVGVYECNLNVIIQCDKVLFVWIPDGSSFSRHHPRRLLKLKRQACDRALGSPFETRKGMSRARKGSRGREKKKKRFDPRIDPRFDHPIRAVEQGERTEGSR